MKKLSQINESIWRDTIVRNAEGRVRTEDSLEVRLQDFCDRHGRDKKFYTITPNELVNCSGDIFIWDDDLVDGKLPFKFGEVTGNFDCSGCYNLKSLEGCPQKVFGYFSCAFCRQLDSLEGCPEVVIGNFLGDNCKRPFTKDEIIKNCSKVTGKVRI